MVTDPPAPVVVVATRVSASPSRFLGKSQSDSPPQQERKSERLSEIELAAQSPSLKVPLREPQQLSVRALSSDPFVVHLHAKAVPDSIVAMVKVMMEESCIVASSDVVSKVSVLDGGLVFEVEQRRFD